MGVPRVCRLQARFLQHARRLASPFLELEVNAGHPLKPLINVHPEYLVWLVRRELRYVHMDIALFLPLWLQSFVSERAITEFMIDLGKSMRDVGLAYSEPIIRDTSFGPSGRFELQRALHSQ